MVQGRLRVTARVGPLLCLEGFKDHSTNIFVCVEKMMRHQAVEHGEFGRPKHWDAL